MSKDRRLPLGEQSFRLASRTSDWRALLQIGIAFFVTGKEREKDSDRKKKREKETQRRRDGEKKNESEKEIGSNGEMETREEREKAVLQTERDVLGGERKVNKII